MNQVMERFMRVQIGGGVKNEDMLTKIIEMFVMSKQGNEDDSIYDLFVAEFNNR